MLLIISPKEAYATKRLTEEAAVIGMSCAFISIQELAADNFSVDVSKYDALFVRQAYPYFAEVEQLIGKFIEQKKLVLDANLAEGNIGRGKLLALDGLAKAGIPIPNTLILDSNKVSNFPVILKWNFGFGGQHVFLARNQSEYDEIAARYETRELLIQDFISADFEYKVITVGYKSIPVVLKLVYDRNRARPDFTRCESVAIATVAEVVRIAEQAAQALGRELAKVDILEKDGQLFVLEVNRWPGFQSFEQFTGYNIAKDFLAYISSKIIEPQPFPQISSQNGIL